MPIKRSNVITKADFEDALDYLGSSISQIAQESGIPRAYLSDLKNRNIRLRREYEEKLRAYLQAKQVEFEDSQDEPAATPRTPHPDLNIGTATRCYFAIAETLNDETVEQAMAVIEANDARISLLLDQKAEQEVVFLSFSEPVPTQATKDGLAEIERLSAENYLLFRKLTGWRALRMASAEKDEETIRDLVNKNNLPLFMEAGFIQAEASEEAEAA